MVRHVDTAEDCGWTHRSVVGQQSRPGPPAGLWGHCGRDPRRGYGAARPWHRTHSRRSLGTPRGSAGTHRCGGSGGTAASPVCSGGGPRRGPCGTAPCQGWAPGDTAPWGSQKEPPHPHPSGGASQGWCNGPRLPGIPKDHNPVCPTETPWGPRTPHRDTMNDTRTPRPTQETPSPHRNTLLYTGTSLPGVPHRTSCTTEGPLPRPLGTHCDPSGPQASHGDPLHPIRRSPCTT